jgi:repressor LexA
MQLIQLETLPILGRIRAGVPLFAEEHIVGQIEVPSRLKRRADFALEVSGDSMIGAGLSQGDYVFLRTADRHPATHGNIVAAMVDGEMTLKRYVKRDGRYWLHAENQAYVDIPVDEKVQIQGVYVGRYSEFEGVVEPPLEDMSEDELITKLATMKGMDPDTLAGLIDVLTKKKG